MNHDDRRLISECLAGRRAAFGELVQRYQDRLFNAVLRVVNNPEDAADVVQDSFINAYQALASFKGDSEFYTWLYRIAFNTAVSLRRRRRPTVSLESARNGTGGVDPSDESESIRPGAAMERAEDEATLKAALERLSTEHRSVLVLKDIEGMKYEEIAAVMEVPIGTVRSRIHRARLELRELLEPSEKDRSDPVKASSETGTEVGQGRGPTPEQRC